MRGIYTAQRRNTGLLSLVLVVAASAALLATSAMFKPARAINDCSDAAYIAAFDPRIAGGRCREVTRVPVRWSGRTAYLRVLAMDDVQTAAPRLNIAIGWINDVARRLETAMPQMGNLQLDDVTIMITNLPPATPAGAEADAWVQPFRPYAGQCIGVAANFDASYDPKYAKYVLAHEIFHCIQLATWSGSLNPAARDWVIEGSAEYFAHFVIPGTDNSDSYVDVYERQALRRSLLDFGYENVVFFSWLDERQGPPGVKAFLDRVTSGRDRESYRSLAQSALAPADWKDFATAFVGRRIHLPGSTTSIGAKEDELPRHKVSSQRAIRLRADALVVVGAVIQYSTPAKYNTRVITTAGPYGATRELTSGTWAPFPGTIDVPCDQSRDYYVASMSASASGQTVEITPSVVGRPYECVVCAATRPSAPRDRCVVGVWRYTAPPEICELLRLRAKDNNTADNIVDMTECTIGEATVTFAAHGAVTGELTGNRTVVKITKPKSIMTMITQFDRTQGQAAWSAERGSMEMCESSGTMTGSITISVSGHTTTKPINQRWGPWAPARASYTCNANELRLQFDQHAGELIGISKNFTLRRVR